MLKQRAQTTKPKLEKPQKAPPAHMQAPPEQMQLPWTNACKTPLETGQLQQLSPDWSDRSTPPVRQVCNM
jgi:hypothetical protein